MTFRSRDFRSLLTTWRHRTKKRKSYSFFVLICPIIHGVIHLYDQVFPTRCKHCKIVQSMLVVLSCEYFMVCSLWHQTRLRLFHFKCFIITSFFQCTCIWTIKEHNFTNTAWKLQCIIWIVAFWQVLRLNVYWYLIWIF